MNKCLICSSDGTYLEQNGLGAHIMCPNCGEFVITLQSELILNPEIKIKLSAILRERKNKGLGGVTILSKETRDSNEQLVFPGISIEELIKGFPEKISERIDRSLCNLANMSTYHGAILTVQESDNSLFFTRGEKPQHEMLFLIEQLQSDGLLEVMANDYFPKKVKLTVSAWNRVAELERATEDESNQAFVAMWFDNQVEDAYDKAISVAISKAGYKPVRIDKINHNNKICDEIIMEIKKSKFVIADFTGDRGGVYFEAGYAMGLGKQVIWTCREDHLGKVHFDTRQYNHIVWQTEDDLREKLYHRIKATIS